MRRVCKVERHVKQKERVVLNRNEEGLKSRKTGKTEKKDEC